jgi:hypothetical protein
MLFLFLSTASLQTNAENLFTDAEPIFKYGKNSFFLSFFLSFLVSAASFQMRTIPYCRMCPTLPHCIATPQQTFLTCAL